MEISRQIFYSIEYFSMGGREVLIVTISNVLTKLQYSIPKITPIRISIIHRTYKACKVKVSVEDA